MGWGGPWGALGRPWGGVGGVRGVRGVAGPLIPIGPIDYCSYILYILYCESSLIWPIGYLKASQYVSFKAIVIGAFLFVEDNASHSDLDLMSSPHLPA